MENLDKSLCFSQEILTKYRSHDVVRTNIHVNLRNLKKNDNFGLKTEGNFQKRR
jgi:hypothetical protein